MIVFKKINYKNFLSTGNYNTEITLNNNATTLVVGINGSGKSTLLDALSFVLFGKAFRKVNKPQLINSINKKDCLVEIEFSIGSTEYKVIRGMKPDVFQIYKNDILIPQNSRVKEYQEILENQIIKANHKTFCQVVILGSATFKPFMQLDAYNRREIIEDLLDLQIFTVMNDILKKRILDNIDQTQKVTNEKKLIEQKITLYKEHYSKMQSNNEQLIEDKKQRINDTIISINDTSVEIEKYKQIIKQLETSLEEEEMFTSRLENLSSLKHKIEAKLSVLNKEVKFFKHHDDCPTCKQPIDAEFKETSVNNRIDEIEKVNDGLEKLVQNYNDTNFKIKEIMEIHKQINQNNLELHRLNTKINSLTDYKTEIEKEISNLNKSFQQIDNTEIEVEQKKLDIIKKQNSDLIEQRQTMGMVATLLKDGGIKAKIIKQYIPIINKLINKYLSQFEFMCQFELNEEFNETIKSRFRDEFSYSSFSEGEKMRIDISLLFTWRAVAKLRNSINTNILIFDEILDSACDTNSIDYFMGIIKSLSADQNVFIISHKEQMIDKFDSFIKFEKTKSFSRIVSE